MSTDYKWRNEINLKYIYVGDAKCEKGSSDNLLRTLWTNKEQFPLYKDLKWRSSLNNTGYTLEEAVGDLAVLTVLCGLP